MAITPVNITRVSQNMQSDLLISGMQQTMVNLLHKQEQLATGLRIIRPSDDPVGATAAIRMDDLLEAQDQYLKNIDNASKAMNLADSTISSMRDLINQAHTLGLENVGSTATAEQRSSAATLVDSIIGQLVTLGNTEYLGSYLFAGRDNNSPPFELSGNNVKFTGDLQAMKVQVAPEISENMSVTAKELFGTGTGKVSSYKDLKPAADINTRLSDVKGTIGQGIRLGTLVIEGSVMGRVDVDLSRSATIGDIIDKINNALGGSANVSLSADGRSLMLTSANPGETLKVTESGQGTIAHDLGLYTPTATASPIHGHDLSPEITLRSPVTSLYNGTGIDLTSGIIITNGDNSITLDFSTAQTVQDIINTINTSDIGVMAQINAEKTGIEIINQLAGARLSIAENGGTTADDLGIRTYRPETLLSSLNEGLGVNPVNGADFTIIASDGSQIDVDASGAQTVQDIIDRINASASAAGVNLTASFAQTGNGIIITDNTTSTGTLEVRRANLSNVAQELGILKQASGGSKQIVGDDVNPIKEESIFTYLLDLRSALGNNDTRGIQLASQNIEEYMDQLNEAHGKLGFMARGLDIRKTRTQDAVLSTKALLSQIKDLDYTEAITKFKNLQTALQANLQMGGQILNTSLLDFLR